jgi:hypothetical protein
VAFIVVPTLAVLAVREVRTLPSAPTSSDTLEIHP